MKIVISILMILLIVAVACGVYFYFKRKKYTRERFSFAALTSVSSMTVIVLTSIKSNVMPWHFVLELFNYLTGKNIPLVEIAWTDYAVLVLVYGIGVKAILTLHRNWDGLKSYNQYHSEQKNQPSGLVEEGIGEIRRIAKHEPPLAPFSQTSIKPIFEFEVISDSLAWKDQSRDLLRLTSTSYIFQPGGWHDNAGYWVGKNVNNNTDVFLYPVLEEYSSKDIHSFVDYVDSFRENKKNEAEYIIAIKISSDCKTVKYKNKIIRIETEESLLSNLVNFRDYKNHIFQRVQVEKLPDSDCNLLDIYVPGRYDLPNGKKDVATVTHKNIEDYLLSWIKDTGERQVALLGEYGQGKSTSTLMFTYHLLKNNIGRIPLLIELRGTSPRNLSPLQLLGAWASQYNLNPQSLMKLHLAGKLILIFEGFDEMSLVGDTEMRLKHFMTLWEFCHSKAKIIITGRPNFFLDEEEMKVALGLGRAICFRQPGTI